MQDACFSIETCVLLVWFCPVEKWKACCLLEVVVCPKGAGMDAWIGLKEEFLADCEGRGLARNTVRMYRDSLETFEGWMEEQGLTRVPEITTAHLRAYAARSLEQVSPGAAHARLRPLKTMLRWCVNEGVMEADPTRRLRLPKIPDRDLKVVRPATFRRLLKGALMGRKPMRDAALLLALYDTGLRASEVCALKVDDIDSGGFLRVVGGKGGKDRMAPVGRETVRALRSYVLQERPETTLPELFLVDEETPMTRNTLAKMLHRLCETAGVENLSAHAFRRGMAVEFMRQGGDQFALQRIFGHATLHMTNRYARLDRDDLKAAHRRASPVASATRSKH